MSESSFHCTKLKKMVGYERMPSATQVYCRHESEGDCGLDKGKKCEVTNREISRRATGNKTSTVR